ncbi:hypothetical protein [Amycolatopsis sp. NPDC059021]|uniref:hypothetical protein n=1 Tax=Amycolatopsis sp. NPDC059021 TaxID=3346704 RepID=UPI00366E32AF
MLTFARRVRFGALALTLLGAITLSAGPAQAVTPSGHSSPGVQSGWDGYRVKAADDPAVYLVLCGTRRWIPGPATYDNIFADWNGIATTNVNNIPRGGDLSDGAALGKGPNTDATFLISNGLKMWISSPATFDKYHFDWSKIRIVDQGWLDGVPSGCSLY